MMRGIVAAPGLIEPRHNGFVFQRSISPEELRYYLLYWDKVVIPGTNLVYIEVPDESVLIETGVISRPKISFNGRYSGSSLVDSLAFAQAKVAATLIADDKDTDWVVHQIGSTLSLPDAYKTESRNLRVDLTNLLPVPEGDAPIIEILEFKERRRDELGYLHQCLDETYSEILSSPDPSLTQKVAVDRLRRSLLAVNKTASEKWKKTRKFDLSAELNLDGNKIITGVAAGAAFDFYTAGFGVPIGVMLGGVASAIKVSAKVTATFEPAKDQMKLGYLSRAHDEHIIKRNRNSSSNQVPPA